MSLLATVVAGTALGVLGVSGLAHLRRLDHLGRSLRRQALPRALRRVVTPGLVAAEVGVGLVGLTALVTGFGGAQLLRWALGASAALYLAFAVYAAVLVRRRQEVPCGCGSEHEVVSGWTVARAAVLAAGSLWAWSFTPGPVLSLGLGFEVALAAVGSLGFTTLVWTLPAALHDPGRGVPNGQIAALEAS